MALMLTGALKRCALLSLPLFFFHEAVFAHVIFLSKDGSILRAGTPSVVLSQTSPLATSYSFFFPDFQNSSQELLGIYALPGKIIKDSIRTLDEQLVSAFTSQTVPEFSLAEDRHPCIEDEEGARTKISPAKSFDQKMEMNAKFSIVDGDPLTSIKLMGYKVGDPLSEWIKTATQKKLSFVLVRIQETVRIPIVQVRVEGTNSRLIPSLFSAQEPSSPVNVYIFTKNSRAEVKNYRLVRLQSDKEIPSMIAENPAQFIDAYYLEQNRRESGRAVFLQFSGPARLRSDELKLLSIPTNQFFLTHLKFFIDPQYFKDDIEIKESTDSSQYRLAFSMRERWSELNEGTSYTKECRKLISQYDKELLARAEKEAQTLAGLTGWDIREVRRKMQLKGRPPKGSSRRWFEKLWQMWNSDETHAENTP